jgi:arsenate reductase (thioredoxin)
MLTKGILVIKTTVLFLCPDNSLLGPLAEAYMNFRAGTFLRAFSAGTVPADRLSRHVGRLLAADGVDAKGLSPKPVEIFWMPQSVFPDRVIYLADMAPVAQASHWNTITTSDYWGIADCPRVSETFGACAACYQQIKKSIDQLIDPPKSQP